MVLVPVIEPLIGPLPAGTSLAWLALMELLVGGLLGLSAGLIVAGARQAGDLVAAQAGLSTAALFDPETGDELTALGHLYGLIAVAVFLAMDGPLVLIASLMESYRTVPAGGLVLGEPMVSQAFERVGRRPGALAPGGRPGGRGPGGGGHRHGLDRPAGSGRPASEPLPSRAVDPRHRPGLPQPGYPGGDALAGMEQLAVGRVKTELASGALRICHVRGPKPAPLETPPAACPRAGPGCAQPGAHRRGRLAGRGALAGVLGRRPGRQD